MEFDDKSFRETMEKMTKLAIDSSLAYAAEQSNKIIAVAQKTVEARLKPQILEVKIDTNPVVTLTNQAVPFLGRMIINAQLGLNTLLVGPAGCGKTFAAAQLAEAMGLTFGHLCLTAGASETWLFGRQTPNGFIEGVFSKLYREGGVFLADEFDAADPNLLLSINTALANGALYNPISGQEIKRHNSFVFIAACNTFGKGGDHVYTGRNRLDAATLDRFITLQVDYNEQVEEAVCPDNELRLTLQHARNQLRAMQSSEVISTRAIQAAYKQKTAGVNEVDIYKSITLSWAPEIAKVMNSSNEDVRKKLRGSKR